MGKEPCTVDGCDQPSSTRGYCSSHYHRVLRYGDPFVERVKRRPSQPPGPCEINGCSRRRWARGMCQSHYNRFMRFGDALYEPPLAQIGNDPSTTKRRAPSAPGPCSLQGCAGRRVARGYCNKHYERFMKYGDPLGVAKTRRTRDLPCEVEGCDRFQKGRGFCQLHLQRFHRHGDPTIASQRPRGDGTVVVNGYRVLVRPSHPNAGKHGRISEHRLVMSEKIGRPLLPGETAHHKNGIRLDNRPSNLELWAHHHPDGQRAIDLLNFAREIISIYAPIESQLA